MSRRTLALRMLAVAGGSFLVLLAGYIWGKAGDCAPTQIDGQCGMSTAKGEVAGLLLGMIFLVGGWSMLIVRWNRRRAGELERAFDESKR